MRHGENNLRSRFDPPRPRMVNHLFLTPLPLEQLPWWFSEHYDPAADAMASGWVVGFEAESGAGIEEEGCPLIAILRDRYPFLYFYDLQKPFEADKFVPHSIDYKRMIFRMLVSGDRLGTKEMGWPELAAKPDILPMLICYESGGMGWMAVFLEYNGSHKWDSFVAELESTHNAVRVGSMREMPVW
jgi:hypothetical protein